mgnify:CR=1 FL=1
MKKNPSYLKQEYTPFLYDWDKVYLSNYLSHKTALNSLKTGFFASVFPERSFLRMKLFKQMKIIGSVFPIEFTIYKNIDSNINFHYNSTFNYFQEFPSIGFAVSFTLFLLLTHKKLPIKKNLGFIAIPIVFHGIYNEFKVDSWFKTLNFLNWLVEFRKAKGFIFFKIIYNF